MANVLEYAQIFQEGLDKEMIAGASSGWMEANAGQVKYNGGNEVKIPDIAMDGLGDYDRALGFVEGAVTSAFKTYTLTQDRGRTFMLDAMDVDETNFAVQAANVMGEFQRTKVIPEIDAYRYSNIATTAITNSRYSSGYTPAEADILGKLLDDIMAVQDVIGDAEELVITMPIPVARIFATSEQLQRRLDVKAFARGDVSTKVKSLDGIPIIEVPSARMKTEYLFNSGGAGQETGGFATTANSKNINWLITARRAVVAISKTDKIRIFEPNTNQTADAWKLDYRKYHDLWIAYHKLMAVWANIKETV